MPTVFTKDGYRFFFYSNDHTPIHVHVRKGSGEAVFIVKMDSGTELRFDVMDHKRLRSASHAELNEIEISPFGLHWPKLDEDLSIRGLQVTNKNG